MKRSFAGRLRAAATGLALGFLAGTATPSFADEPPTFERDIKPLFAKRCTACHNRKTRDDPDVSAGLALDTYAATMAGSAEHKVVVPGRASDSELYRRLVIDDDETRMPLLEKP